MKIVVQNVIWLLMFVAYNYLCLAKDSITIGALVNDEDSQAEMPLRSMVYAKNLIDQRLFYKINLRTLSKSDSFACSKILCNMTASDDGVAAIFGPDSLTSSAIIQSMCSYFEIPHIQTSWRPSGSPISSTVLNFFPEADLFAQGIAEIVRSLQWDKFVIIYETEEGLIKLQEVLKLQEMNDNNMVISFKQLGPGPDYRPLIKDIQSSQISRVILDCHIDNIIPVLQQAKEVNMLEIFHSFFLTSLDAHTLNYSALNTGANITSIRLFEVDTTDFKNAVRNWELSEYHLGRRVKLSPSIIKTDTVLTHDAVLLFIDSLNTLQLTQTLSTKPIMCNGTAKWPDGFAIMNFMRIKQPSLTLSGPLKFDEYGRRIDFQVNCIEILQNKTIATWTPTRGLNLSSSAEEKSQMILENLQKTTVIVASRLGRPYLMERKPKYEGEVLIGNARYEGYAMDLIAGIAEILNFTFEFRLNKDYGKPDPSQGGKWNGLIGEIIERKAHLAICDLTINHQRKEVVDFSMPFMTLGIGILHKKTDKKEVNMFAFLAPFHTSVWMYTVTLFLLVSVTLVFIIRAAPGDWENPHPCDDNPEELENIWHINNCFWLTMGSIMTQGCDILPKGFSSRLATSMWWFFSLIMTSSYTANLAAFLTTTRMEPAIDSAEALSKQTKIKYGTIDGGSTQAFFRDSNYSTYQRMWLSMSTSKPSVFENGNDDGVNRVLTTRNGLYAFLMESLQIEYFIQTKCDLRQVGAWLDSKGYGIAMPLNSPYASEINRAVLRMQEDGKLQTLKTKWWKLKRNEPLCDNMEQEETSSSELAFANVGGVFLVLGIGIGIAFFLAIMEFLWNVRSVAIQEHISYWEALKVEVKFACNIWITKKRTKPEISESSSSSSDNNGDNRSIAHSILHNAGSLFNINKLSSVLNLDKIRD